MKKLLEKIKPNPKKIYIIPTVFGVYFLGIVFVLFLISLSYGHSLALTTTFFFVSVIMASAHFTNFNLSKVNLINIKQNHFCHEGEDVLINFIIENRSQRDRFGVELELYSETTLEMDHIDMDPDSITKGSLKLSNLKRGLYKVSKIKLSSSFPFGLFKAWKVIAVNLEINVFPKKANLLPLPPGVFSNVRGEEGGHRLKNGSEDFYGHEKFIEGSSWKNIDWKAFSRTGDLVSKSFSEISSGRVLLDFEHLKSLNEEERVGQLTSWADQCFHNNMEFAVVLPHSKYEFGSGQRHLKHEFQRLALFGKRVQYL